MKKYSEEDYKKLQDWFMGNMPKDSMIYKSGYGEQILFVRDSIYGILLKIIK